MSFFKLTIPKSLVRCSDNGSVCGIPVATASAVVGVPTPDSGFRMLVFNADFSLVVFEAEEVLDFGTPFFLLTASVHVSACPRLMQFLHGLEVSHCRCLEWQKEHATRVGFRDCFTSGGSFFVIVCDSGGPGDDSGVFPVLSPGLPPSARTWRVLGPFLYHPSRFRCVKGTGTVTAKEIRPGSSPSEDNVCV